MVYFSDIMYFQMIHIMLFQPITHTDNIKFVKFPKDICIAKQRFFDHIFSQHDKFPFSDIEFTSGLNQNTE